MRRNFSGGLSLQSIYLRERYLSNGFYNWACFKAQQSAEMAIKAGIGEPKIGHSISYLLPLIQAPQQLVDLDKLYIPTRYPDAWSSGTPDFYYTYKEAEDAIKYAEEIIKFVEDLWMSLKRGR
ncbi:MAG: HEPN domain-containing protein [Sulfolobus sp.]|nr:HEPN domain-containing protein [Sulfolobus sp.]